MRGGGPNEAKVVFTVHLLKPTINFHIPSLLSKSLHIYLMVQVGGYCKGRLEIGQYLAKYREPFNVIRLPTTYLLFLGAVLGGLVE